MADLFVATVDQDVCFGSEMCTNALPDVFALQPDGVAGLRGDGTADTAGPTEVDAELHAALQSTAWNCPAGAIAVTRATKP